MLRSVLAVELLGCFFFLFGHNATTHLCLSMLPKVPLMVVAHYTTFSSFKAHLGLIDTLLFFFIFG